MFAAIAGVIGVGKTTTVTEISKRLDFKPLFETVKDHPYLEKFYYYLDLFEREPLHVNKELCQAYSFRTQEFFLKDRWLKHISALGLNNNVIADRTIYEDTIFAKMLTETEKMSKIDYNRIYLPMFNFFGRFLPHPDLLIYLTADSETLMDRIRNRDRNIETKITKNYIEQLSEEYDSWFSQYSYSKIKIEANGNFYDNICNKILLRADNLGMEIRKKEEAKWIKKQ